MSNSPEIIPVSSYPDWVDREEYPFHTFYYNTPNGKMHFVDEGKGDPVVMIHGNPVWSFVYRKVIKQLSGNYRCIAPDHLGFGLSDKPENWDYLPVNHAQNLELLLNELQLNNITLVVNDWGGPTGLAYALKYPGKIKKLIILNTWMWSVKDEAYYRNFSGFMGGSIGRFLIKHYNFFAKVVVKKAIGKSKPITKQVHDHYCQHLPTANDRIGCYVFPKEIIGSSEWLNILWQQKDKISSIPTIFIWGMQDIAFREKELNNWVKNWNNARVYKVATSGHYPQETDPEYIVNEFAGGKKI